MATPRNERRCSACRRPLRRRIQWRDAAKYAGEIGQVVQIALAVADTVIRLFGG